MYQAKMHNTSNEVAIFLPVPTYPILCNEKDEIETWQPSHPPCYYVPSITCYNQNRLPLNTFSYSQLVTRIKGRTDSEGGAHVLCVIHTVCTRTHMHTLMHMQTHGRHISAIPLHVYCKIAVRME